MNKNDYLTWGLTLDFYKQGEAWGNPKGGFLVPPSLYRNFLDSNKKFNAQACIQTLFNIYINYICSIFQILNHIKFSWLKENTKFYLRCAVCAAILNDIENNRIVKRTSNTSISGTNFSYHQMSNDVTLGIQLLGQRAWSFIKASELAAYDIVNDEDASFVINSNKNIEFIGKYDLDKIKELI